MAGLTQEQQSNNRFTLGRKGRHIWEPSCFAESVGITNSDAATKYIDKQHSKERQHDNQDA